MSTNVLIPHTLINVYVGYRFREMLIEILNGKDITQIVPTTTVKNEMSPIQLRIQSTETLSSLEFDVFQVNDFHSKMSLLKIT